MEFQIGDIEPWILLDFWTFTSVEGNELHWWFVILIIMMIKIVVSSENKYIYIDYENCMIES